MTGRSCRFERIVSSGAPKSSPATNCESGWSSRIFDAYA
jgi:hypothetical protein